MSWLAWRQHRGQLTVAALVLAAVTLVLVASGIHIAAVYRAALATCRPTGSCDNLGPQVFAGDGVFFDIVNLTLAAPLLIGMFWGAPLVASEAGQSTHKLIWTQTITRRRWLAAKVTLAVLVAVVWGGILTALVTWWSGPENAIDYTRFYPGQFDLQGLVPVAYCLFAVALGIAAGTVIRRTIPAIAATVAIFAGVRFLLTEFARQHFIPPVSESLPVGSHLSLLKQNVWTLSAHTIVRAGHVLSHPALPPGCRGRAHFSCLTAAGLRQVTIYQPGSRYWAFQGIESGIYALLGIGLIALSFTLISRRDA
jgi:hypothetical protein